MVLSIFRNLARYIMSVIFIFSGFVKAIDPFGSAYKFSDYFEAFGIEFLASLALPLGILLSSAELLIGLCLFFKLRMRVTSWALLIFMSFFTILTFFVALTNPVNDCGCFGDAVILTNWQTFFKNIIFFVPTFFIFHQRNLYRLSFEPIIEWSLAGLLFLSTILLSVYCIRNLPLIDFRPYKPGSNIVEGMQIPEGMPVDRYETFLIYEKEGVQKEYTLESPEEPWNDSSYTLVDTRSVLVSEGYEPPIHDFNLFSAAGDEITDQVLYDPGYSFLIVAYDIEHANKEGLQRINKLAEVALANGVKVYGMTASMNEVVQEVCGPLELNFEFYTTDGITLKTMIRSNPGLILLKEGTVIGKWHHRNIPAEDFLKGQLMANSLSLMNNRLNRNIAFLVILVLAFLGSVLLNFVRIEE